MRDHEAGSYPSVRVRPGYDFQSNCAWIGTGGDQLQQLNDRFGTEGRQVIGELLVDGAMAPINVGSTAVRAGM